MFRGDHGFEFGDRFGVATNEREGVDQMWWIIGALAVGFIVGLVVGVVWANIAMADMYGRHFGW
jgi:hypothetical protein